MSSSQPSRLPLLAYALTVGGAIPFIVCGIVALSAGPGVGGAAMFGLPALIAYGAVILSFVGAVHWGFAIGGGEMVPRQVAVRLFLGVLPSLVGWSAMLLELSALPERALLLLIGGFAGTVVIEQRWSTAGFVPPGYMLLRWTVTVAVVLILALVLTLRLAGNPIVL